VLKPASLRSALTSALPELLRDPDKLAMFIKAGNIINTGTPALSWQYSYTLSVMVLDYAGHVDAIFAPLLLWLRRHQAEVFDNPERREKAIRFDADFLTASTADVLIEIDLTESVLARPRPDTPGALNLIHPPEPPHPLAILQAEEWEIFIRDEKVAQWHYEPR